MPVDKNGHELEEGMIVLVKMRVKNVSKAEDYCNLNLETVEPMYPSGTPIYMALNAKQVEVIG